MITSLFLIMASCTENTLVSFPQATVAKSHAPSAPNSVTPSIPLAEATITPGITPSAVSTTTPTQIHTPTAQISGPDVYPSGVNPLTGLPVKDPQSLLLPPALVSISNSPVTARPQAGLSFSPLVFEMYIGEGATRFLAMFYGDYPIQTDDNEAKIGPIRSGRLPYEKIRSLYYGFLIFAGASQRVLPGLDEYSSVFNEDPDDINGAMITSDELITQAENRRPNLGEPQFSGLSFDPQPPPGGKSGEKAWVDFHYYAQVFWQYNSSAGAYNRYQDTGEDTELILATDRLNGEALAFENVIILYTNFHRYDELLFNFDLLYTRRFPALLFRDGKMYEIYWTTGNDTYELDTGRLRPIRFIDYDSVPVPLKPGQTWIEIAQLNSPYYETIDTTKYHVLSRIWEQGSGFWAVRNTLPYFEPTQNAVEQYYR